MRKNMNNVTVATVENATVGNVALVVDNTKTDKDTEMARSIMDNTYTICNKRIASVPVSLMKLDESYQREIDKSNIQKLVRDWDNDRCDFLLVSFRDDRFYVVDGQHRYTAADYRGIKALPCIILTELTREQEARIYSRQNENVKKLTIYDVFKANIVNGDTSIPEIKIDMEINKVCKKYGIKVCKNNRYLKKNALRSLSATRSIVRIYGVECFEWILSTANKTNWKTCSEITSKQIQDMLKNFWVENKNNLGYWQEAVERVMNTYTPKQIIGCARSDYANYTMGVALNICFKELVNGNKIIKVGVEQ